MKIRLCIIYRPLPRPHSDHPAGPPLTTPPGPPMTTTRRTTTHSSYPSNKLTPPLNFLTSPMKSSVQGGNLQSGKLGWEIPRRRQIGGLCGNDGATCRHLKWRGASNDYLGFHARISCLIVYYGKTKKNTLFTRIPWTLTRYRVTQLLKPSFAWWFK